MRFTVNDGINRETIEASDPAEAKMAFVERHGLAPDEHDFVTATPARNAGDEPEAAESGGPVFPAWDDLECPSCGGADVDLAETSRGPLLECRECGERFDPEDDDERLASRGDKPRCPLVGTDGNAFAVIGNVARCLRDAGQPERAKAWIAEAMASTSYDQVIEKVFTYVDPL